MANFYIEKPINRHFLVTDGTIPKLIEFGKRIGLKSEWFQTNWYRKSTGPRQGLGAKGRSGNPRLWTPCWELTTRDIVRDAIDAGAIVGDNCVIRCYDAWVQRVSGQGTAPCLTIKQPWAWLIMHGYKKAEIRSWQYKYKGELFIHAAKVIDRKAFEWLTRNKPQIASIMPKIENMPTGGIVGRVYMNGCMESEGKCEFASPEYTGKYRFQFETYGRLPFISYMGAQGVFCIPRALYEGVL